MNIKFGIPVLIFILAASLLFPGKFPQNKKEKAQEIKEHKSLIRKELLTSLNKTLIPPKRNIFTRQRAGAIANEISSSGDFQAFQAPGQKKSPDQQETAIEETRINVNYIGYVKSGKRVVALIIFEGETYAVESGDVLEMGLTIGDITPDKMEIINLGSEPIKINLEGEKP